MLMIEGKGSVWESLLYEEEEKTKKQLCTLIVRCRQAGLYTSSYLGTVSETPSY